jgi:hypothetical protein
MPCDFEIEQRSRIVGGSEFKCRRLEDWGGKSAMADITVVTRVHG